MSVSLLFLILSVAPSTEGWAAIAIFAVFQLWNFMRLDETSHSASDTLRPFLIQSVIAALVLIGIAYARGEKPGWRWGGKARG